MGNSSRLLCSSTPIYGGVESYLPHLSGVDILARFLHGSKKRDGDYLKKCKTLRLAIFVCRFGRSASNTAGNQTKIRRFSLVGGGIDTEFAGIPAESEVMALVNNSQRGISAASRKGCGISSAFKLAGWLMWFWHAARSIRRVFREKKEPAVLPSGPSGCRLGVLIVAVRA